MRSLLLCAAALVALSSVAAAENKVVCYFGSWSVYRQSKGQININDIDPKLCTHLIYSFVLLNGNKVVSADPWADLGSNEGGGKDGYRLFNELKKKNPAAKVLIAIGGWNDSQGAKYSNMVSSPQSRKEFVESVVNYVKKYNFDGFDVDWEYPTKNGGKPSDRGNYILLLKELREAFNKAGGFLLTAAVAAPESTAAQAYDVPQMSKYLDFINLMTYDFHGSWERQTGHHAAFKGALSVETVVNWWLKQGAPKEKLIVGIPTYGRAWTLANPSNTAVGAPASGAGAPGPYTKEASNLGYNEICELLGEGDWTVQFDEQARAPFAFKGNQWVGYDNVKSVTEKANYIKKLGLGGAMIWSIETDDFRGTCGEKFPILKTLNHVLRNGKAVKEEKIPSAPVKPSQPQRNQRKEEPKAPKAPNSGASGQCVDEGQIVDPNSCGYIACVRSDSGFVSYNMPCPEGLCFNGAIGACDWPQQ